MNTLKKVMFVLFIIMFIFAFNNVVYGLDLSSNTSNDSIKVGDEVTYTLKFDEPILTADFILSYDNSKLDYVGSKTENVEFNNYEQENYIQFLYVDESGTGTDTIELTFKAKELTSATYVKLDNLNVHSKTENISYSIENADEINEFTTQQISIVENSNGNNEQNENNNAGNSYNTGTSNNTYNGTLPYAGIGFNILLIIVGILLIVIFMIILVKNKDKLKNIFPIIIFMIIFTIGIKSDATNDILMQAYQKIKGFENIIVMMPNLENRNILYGDFLNQTTSGSNIVEAKNAKGENLEQNSLIGTGTTFELTSGSNYQVIVYGDVDGDGKVNSNDIAEIIQYTLNIKDLDGIFKKASNLSNINDEDDNMINSDDIKKIKDFILNRLENNLVDELPKELEDPAPSEVTGISIKNAPTKTTYVKGENLDLTGGTLTVSYEDGSTAEISMTSSGVGVTGYKANETGDQTLTVTYAEKSTTFTVTVKNEITKISIKNNPTKTTYKKGENLDLTGGILTVSYEDGSTAEVPMTSSGVGVTGFNSNQTGNQTITITYSGQRTTFTVTVKNNYTVSLSQTNIELDVNESTILSGSITPTDFEKVSYEYTNSNSSAVKVEETDQFGVLKITGLSQGTATLKFTINIDDDVFTATCNVTVNAPNIPVTGITLDSNKKTLVIGNTGTLTAKITPDNATNKEFEWSTKNSSIVQIVSAQNGTLTFKAVGTGTTTITATTKDGSHTASCEITVTAPTSTSTPLQVVEEGKIVDKNGNEVLLSGVNLGGWMIQEYWMCPVYDGSWDSGEQWANLQTLETLQSRGFTDEQIADLYKTYEDNWLTEYDFQKMAEIGINCVRVPFWYRNFMNNPEGEWINSDFSQNPGFQRLDWVISECKKYNIYVILDLHGAPGGQGSGHCDGSKTDTVFTNAEHRAACIKLWEAIANRYKDEEIVAMYDLLNEPTAGGTGIPVEEDRRNILYDDLYKAIRAIDSKHIICMEAMWTYDKLPNPADMGWENVSYSVHYYSNSNIPEFAEYCRSINVAPYQGEYHGYDQLEVMINNGVHSTFWTWKRMGGGDTAYEWGLFVDIDGDWADVTTESYESIKRKWGTCLQTENYFDENTKYIEMFKNLLAN